MPCPRNGGGESLLGGVLPPPGVLRQQALLRLAKRAAEGHPLSLEEGSAAALQKKLLGNLLGIQSLNPNWHFFGGTFLDLVSLEPERTIHTWLFSVQLFVGVDRSFKKLKNNLNYLYLWDLWDSMYTLRNMCPTNADSITCWDMFGGHLPSGWKLDCRRRRARPCQQISRVRHSIHKWVYLKNGSLIQLILVIFALNMVHQAIVEGIVWYQICRSTWWYHVT